MCSPLTTYCKKLFGVVDQVTSKNIYLTLSRTFIRETLVTSFHKSSSSDVFSAGMHASFPLRNRESMCLSVARSVSERRMSNQVELQNESAVDENTELVNSTANVRENKRYVCPLSQYFICGILNYA